MKIGIVSDTHGHVQPAERATKELLARGAEALVHCGDIGSAECLAVLARAGVPVFAVAGNTDRALAELRAAADRWGVTFAPAWLNVPLGDGREMAVTHGHLEDLLDELIAGGQYAYVCHGHSHRRRDERRDSVHIINPGALHRANPHSAALLDSVADEVIFIDIDQID